ncbi:hypothetical protein P280DRAFT_466340 [Massarina eburnea CBS 473.64]|uniref:Cytosolic regulator pianissimo n=1 Tax=Massarina eburnea CBS 473.64 TaxID=1395130 RepID=A0A6A6SFU9_9PLEO|nr:hypothetical protein P280DRAFT_466340 [Massarina eburnea CBS 473.64]
MLMTPSARSVNAQADPDQVSLLAPTRSRGDGRSLPAQVPSAMAGSRTQASYATAREAPGSFSSQLRPTTSHDGRLRPDFDTHAIIVGDDSSSTTEQRQAELQDRIEKETKIKIGSENLLEALNAKNAKNTRDQRQQVEEQLNISNRKLQALKSGLAIEIQRAKEVKSPPPDPQSRLSYLFRRNLSRSPSRHIAKKNEETDEAESPTFVLAEILQALESDGMQSEYYVERANSLVDLFKRHPTLKYDLAWSIFGLRMQTMLLSDSREVVAAAYRVMRYAITDRKSLQIIRGLHTDYLVILSLVKESKASVEREQALKFVRAFLDVKRGVEEISRSVIRIIVAVAEHTDDRLRNIAILTLTEILVRKPSLLVSAGGMGTLTDALGEGNYYAAESVGSAFVYLLDTPQRRKFLRSGHELESPFAMFTDAGTGYSHLHEEKLKANAKVIASLLRSWSGLLSLCMDDFLPIRSLLLSLQIPAVHVRNILLELLFDILRIKPPSWSSSFLAGRRLTTYGRVTNLKNQIPEEASNTSNDPTNKWNLLEHYVAAVLAAFLHAGLIPVLLKAEEEPLTLPLKRKTTLLLGEVLKMANELLPPTWSAQLQVLPQLLQSAATFTAENRFVAIGTIYQVDSVNRTLYRSGPATASLSLSKSVVPSIGTTSDAQPDQSKSQAAMQMDEATFRELMVETQILNTVSFQKWRWDLIQNIITGPLLNPKRLDEAMKASKFIHRLLGFYRPFKYRFSDIRNTKPNQRYVRAGCSLMNTLLQTPQGAKYLSESKFIRQLAECLSHFDRMSGLTSENPMFQVDRMNETLTGSYFALLGTLTKDSKGIQILERWRVLNMFYHIIELNDRDDLIRVLLSNMDYSLDGHLRIIISKAMTSCSKEVRIFSTRLLRKYATKPMQPQGTFGVAEWAIKLLVTQLYDPDVEVCEVAIKILEEACNQTESLEFVVKCRPALDHLGEIGAPLLLRFLSTSVGYHYLDGLDYITREMDDWFLGRNDTYVALIEASMARALADIPEKVPTQQLSYDEVPENPEYGIVPPHFYRELTRTKEGCKLLKQKGHFDEFVATIRDFATESEDAELILKVKGCLWAVGNVGSMDLGAPFLESSDVVKWIVHIAENSEVMSLRGTAFYVLGLISRSLHGQEILLESGWDGVINEAGEALGFCLPLDFRKLFSMTPWKAKSDGISWERKGDVKIAVTDNDGVNARILKLATDLGNTVLAKKAANDLQAIKAKKAPGFFKPAMFHKVMQILEAHHFRLPACRFVLDLFDKSVLQAIVLEEESQDEEESTDSDSAAVQADINGTFNVS